MGEGLRTWGRFFPIQGGGLISWGTLSDFDSIFLMHRKAVCITDSLPVETNYLLTLNLNSLSTHNDSIFMFSGPVTFQTENLSHSQNIAPVRLGRLGSLMPLWGSWGHSVTFKFLFSIKQWKFPIATSLGTVCSFVRKYKSCIFVFMLLLMVSEWMNRHHTTG